MSEERPLAFRILVLLYRASEAVKVPIKDRAPGARYWFVDGEIARELGLEIGRVREALAGLKKLGMVDFRSDRLSWGFRGGPVFRFLNKSEFTQDMLREGLGVSRPTASRRMRLLVDLGLVEVSRIEAIPKTGGRRLWFRRA